MKHKGKATFDPESAYDLELGNGVPLVEAAMDIEVGPCVRCGCQPRDMEGGMLENVRIEDGVLMGDNVCAKCALDEDPDFELPE